MAASTASMCLRKESLSVHSQSNSQDSSRFNATSLSRISRTAIVPPNNRRDVGAWCELCLLGDKRFLSFLRQLPRPLEHRVEHGLGEDAGEGVLLGGVIAAEEDEAGGYCMLGAVGEPRFWPDSMKAQRGVPGKGAEAD